MKKNYVAKLGALALAVSLITTGMMGTTLARYADEVKATGTVAIAKWNVDFGKTNSQNSNLDKTFILAETKDTFNAGNVGDGVVAPGDRGHVDLVIDGTGTQVAYKYSVKVDDKNLSDKNVNIKFYTDANFKTPWNNGESQNVTIDSTTHLVSPAKINKTLYWKWEEDNTKDNNALDTTAGSGITDDLTFTVTLSAEQIIEESTPSAP